MAGADEFETIAKLLRPLAADAPEALGLMDDAALIPSRPGYELVVTKDAIVEGVHFLAGDPLDLIARKLLRVNLSDLAAKGAAPYGYFLACAWPGEKTWKDREQFAAGLAQDQAAFGLKLFGGDTVSTSGPMVFSATMLGWVGAGRMVHRSRARAGHLVQVSGPIGDGWLGLLAATDALDPPDVLSREARAAVVRRYRLPTPRLDVSLAGASAAADVSDGLIADAGRIAEASGVAMVIELDRLPLSPEAASVLRRLRAHRRLFLEGLASGGDDYQIVATAPEALPGFTVIGRVVGGQGVSLRLDGASITVSRGGYRHGNEG